MELATEGRLTEQQRKDIRRALGEYMTAEALKPRAVARMLGVSESLLSGIRKGTYAADPDPWLRKIAALIADSAHKTAAAPPTSFVATTEARRILACCLRAVQMPCIAKIIGPSGIGKSEAFREFARRRGDRATYIQAGAALAGIRGVMELISRSLRLRLPQRISNAGMYLAIREDLARRYGGGAASPHSIIVDEATTLSGQALRLLRDLHDDPDVRAAVILGDTARLDDMVGDRRNVAGGYDQIRSRFGAVYFKRASEEISEEDVRLVADGALEALGHSRRLPAASYRYLARLANSEGTYRNVVYRLQTAAALAEGRDKEPAYSVAELDFAGLMLGREASPELPREDNDEQGQPALAVA